MITRKDLIFAVLLTFCLSVTLFGILPISSRPSWEYDPWCDINDDGKIDIRDVSEVAVKYGTSGTAINKTDLLLELLDRVDSIEERQEQTKTIRFFEPNETMNEQQLWKDGAVFVWNPDNLTNNAIRFIHCYFDYQCEDTGLHFRIVVNGESSSSSTGWLVSSTYKSSYVYTFLALERSMSASGNVVSMLPNQDNYTLQFQFSPQDQLNPAHVKNINLIIGVIDGLPAS